MCALKTISYVNYLIYLNDIPCVVMECSTHGYTLHHVPRNSGRTGGGVGVLINDRVKLVTRLEPINNAVSFESMEMIITIVSIYIYD